MARKRGPGQRAGLTRARVVGAAHEILVTDGLDALTMRGLAETLDVSPNALYSHVINKTALIDEVLDDVLGEVQAPADDVADPFAGLYALMVSTHDVLVAHPQLVPLYAARRGARGPNAHRLGNTVLALLARQAVVGKAAREALRVLIFYAIGFTGFITQSPFLTEDEQQPSSAELADNFNSGLRWLLDGIVASQ